MNYLAHAFLSNNDKNLLIGNFIADHVRGNRFEQYHEEIVKGIHLHRRIDTFTDSHELFKSAKRVFYDGFEKYSGVLVDIYFDHLLAKNFGRYSKIPLDVFSESVYTIYKNHQALLPATSSGFLEYVLKNNIYTAYGRSEGIERVLFHLSHRLNHNVQLDQSIELFKRNEQLLDDYFHVFFNDAIKKFLLEDTKR